MTPPLPPSNGSYQCQQSGANERNERDARDVSLYSDSLLYPFHTFPFLYISRDSTSD